MVLKRKVHSLTTFATWQAVSIISFVVNIWLTFDFSFISAGIICAIAKQQPTFFLNSWQVIQCINPLIKVSALSFYSIGQYFLMGQPDIQTS